MKEGYKRCITQNEIDFLIVLYMNRFYELDSIFDLVDKLRKVKIDRT
jgi:hypothetical protein